MTTTAFQRAIEPFVTEKKFQPTYWRAVLLMHAAKEIEGVEPHLAGLMREAAETLPVTDGGGLRAAYRSEDGYMLGRAHGSIGTVDPDADAIAFIVYTDTVEEPGPPVKRLVARV